MKIALFSFSATGNTKALADVIAFRLKEKGAEVDYIDITTEASHLDIPDLSEYQAAVFGAPIHYSRAPRIVRDWMSRLNGNGLKAAMYFTYGGFQVHPTHYSTREILQSSGFKVVASAEFPGKHTYNLVGWDAFGNRPDESDFQAAKDYADILFARFSGEDQGVVQELNQGTLTDEELDKLEDNRLLLMGNPVSRGDAECQMCMVCEELCPTGAMNAERGSADPELCMFCLGCLQACPDEVLQFIDMKAVFDWKMNNDGETQETLAAKKSILYT